MVTRTDLPNGMRIVEDTPPELAVC
eukprot:COSAG06_NODE_2284_length_7174_cov_5.515336_1_plen_24_part_10